MRITHSQEPNEESLGVVAQWIILACEGWGRKSMTWGWPQLFPGLCIKTKPNQTQKNREAKQVPISGQMYKQNVLYVHSELSAFKKMKILIHDLT